MPTILLIRHGESQSNVGKPAAYPDVVELTDTGWQQAGDIAQFLQEAQLIPDLIVTSSYLRTKQTAVPTELAYLYVPVEEWPVKEFTYLATWHKADSTVDDRREAVEVYWEIADPKYVDGQGYVDGQESESFERFIERVRNVRKRLENSNLGTIVVFSHEQFIIALLWLLEREPVEICPETMSNFRNFMKANPVQNGAIIRIQFYNRREGWQYESITSHLGKVKPVSLGQ